MADDIFDKAGKAADDSLEKMKAKQQAKQMEEAAKKAGDNK